MRDGGGTVRDSRGAMRDGAGAMRASGWDRMFLQPLFLSLQNFGCKRRGRVRALHHILHVQTIEHPHKCRFSVQCRAFRHWDGRNPIADALLNVVNMPLFNIIKNYSPSQANMPVQALKYYQRPRYRKCAYLRLG